MEQKISHDDERHLTRAIEKAATVATVNDSLDRNELLAKQLQDEGVDKRFAKVASAAFNKRITVLTFQKTADEHKADPFQLTDANRVYELLGGEPLVKSASVAARSFLAELVEAAAPMQKAASGQKVAKPLFEDTLDYKQLQAHLENVIDKQASALDKWTGIYESLDSQATEAAAELAAYFQKNASAGFEFRTLCNVYGDEFKDAMSAHLPVSTDFSKTASAVLPRGDVYEKTAAMLRTRKAANDIGAFLESYGAGLAEFCKTAAETAAIIQHSETSGLVKSAEISSLSPHFAPAAANLARGVPVAGLAVMQGMEHVRHAGQDAMVAALENAANLYNAGKDVGLHPGSVLDADFLVKDRFRDRLLSWSDMAADPQFSMYPAEQVFQATNKVMDMDTSLERPDRREVLRAQVAQLLAQNNRASTADIAAIAATLKAMAASGGGAAQQAAKAVKEMDKVDRPTMPSLDAAKAILAVDKEPERVDYVKPMVDAITQGEQIANAEENRREDLALKEQAAEEARAYKQLEAHRNALKDRLRLANTYFNATHPANLSTDPYLGRLLTQDTLNDIQSTLGLNDKEVETAILNGF